MTAEVRKPLGVCPVLDCDIEVPLYRFLCRPHWYTIPAPLRREVSRTWQARRGRRTPATIDAHEAAKRRALAVLEERRAHRAARSPGPGLFDGPGPPVDGQ